MAADHPTRGELDEALHEAFAEMERRLRAGEPWDAVAFLADHSDLAADPERAVDLILHEYFLRRELGETLEPEAWFGRFPRWRELLHRRLQGLQTVGGGAADRLDHGAVTEPHAAAPGAAAEGTVPELGRHEVYEEIGRGGMGVVYRARDLVLDRAVALKMIVPRQGLLETPEAVERFYREARAAARLRHPHVIPIHGMGLHQGRHCFTMPLMAGALSGRAAAYRDDPRAAVALVEKIARAVHYAHGQGVIHRDLKPGNILLDERGEPVVADFGLAKVLDAGGDASAPGQRVGTPAYMSPEQAAGHTWEVSPRTDVWALGVILYELLTGKRPFEEKTPEGIYKRVLTGKPAPLRTLRAGLPPELEGVVLKCLQREPDRRYATAGELADDLARWLRGERVRPRGGWRGLAVRAVRHRPVVAAAVALLFAALVVAALVIFADPDRVLRENQRRLANHEPASLIEDAGPPQWKRWALGEGRPVAPAANDGAFTFESFSPAMLELFRGAPHAYRFSAEVRHEKAKRGGEVGIYGTYTFRGDDGDIRCFCALLFNDSEPAGIAEEPGMSTLRLCLRWRRKDVWMGNTSLRLKYFAPAQAPPGQGPWRRLAIEVAPDGIRAFWAEAPDLPLQQIESTLPPEELRDRFRGICLRPMATGQLLNVFPQPEPSFEPSQPLGLYVDDSTASFRRVVVESLP